jgi:hypothetical protein
MQTVTKILTEITHPAISCGDWEKLGDEYNKSKRIELQRKIPQHHVVHAWECHSFCNTQQNSGK